MSKWTELPAGVKPAVAKEFFDIVEDREANKQKRMDRSWLPDFKKKHNLRAVQITALMALHHKYRK